MLQIYNFYFIYANYLLKYLFLTGAQKNYLRPVEIKIYKLLEAIDGKLIAYKVGKFDVITQLSPDY